jgi:hypothetical protein
LQYAHEESEDLGGVGHIHFKRALSPTTWARSAWG